VYLLGKSQKQEKTQMNANSANTYEERNFSVGCVFASSPTTYNIDSFKHSLALFAFVFVSNFFGIKGQLKGSGGNSSWSLINRFKQSGKAFFK